MEILTEFAYGIIVADYFGGTSEHNAFAALMEKMSTKATYIVASEKGESLPAVELLSTQAGNLPTCRDVDLICLDYVGQRVDFAAKVIHDVTASSLLIE